MPANLPAKPFQDPDISDTNGDAAKLAAIRDILTAFDWEQDDRQYALEQIEMVVWNEEADPVCHHCKRAGTTLQPCCDQHPDIMVCSDAQECLAFIVANTPDPDRAS
jgi:hypothetical protein